MIFLFFVEFTHLSLANHPHPNMDKKSWYWSQGLGYTIQKICVYVYTYKVLTNTFVFIY